MLVIVKYTEAVNQELAIMLNNMSIAFCYSDDPDVISSSDYLILPNADNFQQAMAALNSKNLVATIKNYAQAGRPLLGIGLGLHLLFEGQATPVFIGGLELLEGLSEQLPTDSEATIPHQEQAELIAVASDNQLTEGLENATVMYDHDLFVDCELKQIKALSQHSIKFPAIIQEREIVGYQFLPELSGSVGEQALRNFLQ